MTELWNSLPTGAKIFVLCTAAIAAFCVIGAIWQFGSAVIGAFVFALRGMDQER